MFEFVNAKNVTSDILILSSPLTITDSPMAAGASLKAVAEHAGFSCSTVDLNILTVRWVVNHENKHDLVEFFDTGIDNPNIRHFVEEYTASVINMVKSYNCRILGISVFTFVCRPFTEILCKKIKQDCPNIQIVIGGAGIGTVAAVSANWAEELQKQQLIDFFIRGDAEHSWYEFLKGNTNFPGINGASWQQLSNNDLAKLPYPNYDDYRWSWYGSNLYLPDAVFAYGQTYSNQVGLPITGSRGCVRNCKFCDFIITHKNFTWRTAEDIFNEMVSQRQKYDQRAFHFTDSLINGNMKEYRKLITMLADYNEDKAIDQKLIWSSQFIFRPQEQFKEDLWELTAKSGAQLLAIGVESIDDDVRRDLGKNFTNADVEFGLRMMLKYNIQTYFMLMTGYPTETQKIYDNMESWLKNLVPYREIMNIALVGTMSIIQDTYLDQHRDKYKIIYINKEDETTKGSLFDWATSDNLNTHPQRKQWLKHTRETALALGFKVFEHLNGHLMLMQLSEGPLTQEMIELTRINSADRKMYDHLRVIF